MKKVHDVININFFKYVYSNFIKKEKEKEDKLPLITISREKGAGGRPIAHLLKKKLKDPWKVYRKEIVESIAKESSLEQKLIHEVDEKKIPLIDEVISNFFGKRYLQLNDYYRYLIKILSTIGNRGHAIIVGRGANSLFPHALKVRVISDFEYRIKSLIKYQKVSRKKAINLIQNSDKDRKAYTQALFKQDIRNPRNYDIVIKTGDDLNIKDATDIIYKLAKNKFNI